MTRRQLRSPRAGRFFPPLGQEYISVEALSALALFVMTTVALIWANVDHDSYSDTWHSALTLGIGSASITLDLQHWVSEGLMTLFFFVVGLEIKREIVDGELRDVRTAAAPVIAAAGGMVVPALVFVAFNAGTDAGRGWGIPMATDIAFAIGVLALLGPRVPTGAKLFLLTLAIVDDIGAILVIAIFYSDSLDGAWLGAAVAVVAAMVGLRRLGVSTPWAYVVPAVALWVCTHESGLHATLAGVVLGLLTPARPGAAQGPLERIERMVHPLSSFVVVPLFALVSAGVVLDGATFERVATSAVAGGVGLGLVLGKPLGIVGATFLALRFARARLPEGTQLGDIAAIGLVAGIGFTVSLFIADLSFAGIALDDAKVAILLASVVAGALGTIAVLGRHTNSVREPGAPKRAPSTSV